MRSLLAVLVIGLAVTGCGREAELESRDFRTAPFEAEAADSGAIYALVIENALAGLAALSQQSVDDKQLYVRPRLAEQGEAPIPVDVQRVIRSTLTRDVNWGDSPYDANSEVVGVTVLLGPILTRPDGRHVFARAYGLRSTRDATFILSKTDRWRVTGTKDEFGECFGCPGYDARVVS